MIEYCVVLHMLFINNQVFDFVCKYDSGFSFISWILNILLRELLLCKHTFNKN